MAVFRLGQGWDTFRDLEREMDRLLRSVNVSVQNLRVGRHYPPMNLYDLGKAFLFTAELPGTKAEDLDVTVANGVLTLRGARTGPEDAPEERYRRHERLRGTWQRSLPLPERVNEEQLSAEFSNGILKITLPKAEAIKPRRIPVTDVDKNTPAVSTD